MVYVSSMKGQSLFGQEKMTNCRMHPEGLRKIPIDQWFDNINRAEHLSSEFSSVACIYSKIHRWNSY